MTKHSTLIIAIVIAALIVIGLVMSDGRSKSTPAGTNNTGNTTNNESSENKAMLEAIFAADPGEKGTAQQLQTYYDTVVAKAQKADALEISACQGTPAVLQVTAKQNFTIVNKDDQDHEVVHPQFTFKVAGGAEKKDAQVKDVGIYGYSCDETNLAGILFVTP